MAKRKKSKNIISIIVALILMIGATIGIVSIANNPSTTISPSSFAVGSINEQGEYVKNKTTLYSKDFIECQGLQITRDFESIVTYTVHYYDILKKYLGNSGVQNGDYAIEDEFINAKYCRIVISKGNSENIKFYEPYSIAKQLTIKVNKDQNYEQYNRFRLNDKDVAFSDKNIKFENNDTYISCKPIEVYKPKNDSAKENGYTHNTIVIVSEYNFAEMNNENYNSIVSFYTDTDIDYQILAQKDLSKIKPTALSDGRYGYRIEFGTELKIDTVSKAVSVVFNVLKTQPNPEVYLYGYSVIGTN